MVNVNCFNLCTVLASSGIDYDVKIWSPLEEHPSFDIEMAEEVSYLQVFTVFKYLRKHEYLFI